MVATVATIAYARTSAALARESAAREETTTVLYHSLVGEARALRLARGEGYRKTAFDRLRHAGLLLTPDRDVAALRREAVACLGDFAGLEPVVIKALERRDARGQLIPFAFAVSPDSRYVAVGLGDGSVEVYDPRSGARLDQQPAPSPPTWIRALAYSADGNMLVAGNARGAIDRFTADPESGRLRPAGTEQFGKVGAPPAVIGGIVATTDGRTLVLAWDGKSGRVLVRDLAQNEMAELADPDNPPGDKPDLLRAVALSPNGRYVALLLGPANSGANRLTLWDLSSGPPERPSARLNTSLYSLAFDPGGSTLAVGGDQRFTLLEVPSLKPLTTTSIDSATALEFSPDGRSLAVGTITRVLEIWGQPSHRELATLKLQGSRSVERIAFGRDGRMLAGATYDTLSLWDLAGARERLGLSGHDGGVPALAFSPRSALLATAGKDDKTVRIWDAAAGRLVRALPHSADVQACRFSPDGRLLATGSMDGGPLRVWETSHWTEIRLPIFTARGTYTTALAFSRDGSLMAASGGAIRVWRVARDAAENVALEPIFQAPTNRGLCVAFGHDGQYAAYVEADTHIKVRDLAGARDMPFSGPDLMLGWHSLAFRSNRELLYTSASGQAEVWDVAANQRVRSIGAPGTFGSFHIAVSPDGRWLAAESTPWSVSIVDLNTGEIRFTLRPERNPIWSLAWSGDAQRLAVGLSDGGVAVWDLREVQRLLAELQLD
jgi:WD40 repeat protein